MRDVARHAQALSVCLLVVIAIDELAAAASAPFALADCSSGGAAVVDVQHNCSWTIQSATGSVRVYGAASKAPIVVVQTSGRSSAEAAEGFQLTLQRLIIVGVTLSSSDDETRPLLWPEGLFTAVGSGLNLTDVRFIVDAGSLQDYLQHVQRLPRSVVQYYTDGRTFLHIAAWEGRSSRVHSTTLISGACLAPDPRTYLQWADVLAEAGPDGCNVRSVDNTTLIPTLLADGSEPTPQPLLVLITANVSLGFGLKAGSIPINRPVVLVGQYSVPTSVDLYMVVNQLNATSKYAKVYWLSLFIENAAPGDAISSLLSRPMSSAVSANVYAVYCDRMHNCLNTHNSTVVVASQQEMDYVQYMYSMFNSPLPNMRQATDFYHTELKCVLIQMGPGPNGVGMTLHNLTCGAWDLYHTVFTTQPMVAQRLPFPEGAPQITAATRAGPLVQSVRDCRSIQESMKFRTVETRLHVWMLLDNIDLAPEDDPECWQDRQIRYPTQVYGQVHDSAAFPPMTTTVFSFSMGHLRDALQLPPTADNKFLSFFNTTLTQLPQGVDALDTPVLGRLPPGIFTLLMWSVSRSKLSPDPCYVQDVTMWVPQPEYNFFADRAAASSSFAVQLMGDDEGITFKGTTLAPDAALRVQAFDGPGVAGVNAVLRPLADGQLPPNYHWPAAAADSLGAQGGGGLAAAQVVGIVLGSVCGVLLVLAALVAAQHTRRWRLERQRLLPAKPELETALSGDDASVGARSAHSRATPVGSSPAAAKAHAQQDFISVDVSRPCDLLSPLPAPAPEPARASLDSKRSAATASAAAAASSATSGSVPPAGSLQSAGISSSGARSSSSDSISLGLDRWRAAISSTTVQLMERRMQLVHGSNSCSTNSTSGRTPSGASSRQRRGGAAGGGAAGGRQQGHGAAPAGSSSTAVHQQQAGLQIHQLIGQGSFGSVWLGTWLGKRVAVKIMQLPAGGPHSVGQPSTIMAGNQANSPPHMAIMEAVVSSAVSHPNVVQVYTYTVNALGVGSRDSDCVFQAQGAAPGAAAGGDAGACSQGGAVGAVQAPSKVAGWELKLVMEYCNAGTLREALDRRLLHNDASKYLPRASILSLLHDVAAALLHLHSQGVIHGDLKAANVMLTQGADDSEGVWTAAYQHKVTAKVADFGLALPLDPADTHVTLAARGTPTHMSPELFMSGHVSKASDVYAFGILLYELVSSQRAYIGIPTPLLPHEVAVRGLRPTWPPDLPAQDYSDLEALAEACWAQVPQERPVIAVIFESLELMVEGQSALHLLPQCQADEQKQQQQQQQQPGEPQVSPAAQQQLQGQQGKGQCMEAGQQDAPAAGRKNMSWSEVTIVRR